VQSRIEKRFKAGGYDRSDRPLAAMAACSDAPPVFFSARMLFRARGRKPRALLTVHLKTDWPFGPCVKWRSARQVRSPGPLATASRGSEPLDVS